MPDIILNNPLPTSTQYKDVNQYLVSLWDNAQRLQGIERENLAEARLKSKKVSMTKTFETIIILKLMIQ